MAGERDRDHPVAVSFRDLRKGSGLGQVDVEVATGMCRKRISSVENGDLEVIGNLKTKEITKVKIVCQSEMARNGNEEKAQESIDRLLGYFKKLLS